MNNVVIDTGNITGRCAAGIDVYLNGEKLNYVYSIDSYDEETKMLKITLLANVEIKIKEEMV